MSTGLIEIMKRAAMDANDNAKPVDLRYGTVVSTSPLKIQVTNQFTIPSSMLIVPQHLTKYTLDVSVDWTTGNSSGGSGDSAYASHNHRVNGTKTITINNALKTGDKVALLRQAGGQSYFILDRI